MADWSQLPKDLLLQIGDSLRWPVDILRIRSVCSTWRSFIQPKLRSLPDRFPIIPSLGISTTSWGFRLLKRTIYRFSIPPDSNSYGDASDWIFKLSEFASGKMQLMNPLSGLQSSFLGNLDLLKIRACVLGEEYVMSVINYRPNAKSLGDGSNLYDEKVAFRKDDLGFEILTVKDESLVMYRSGDKKWKVIEGMKSSDFDVKLFRGKFYAVDSTGRMVSIESDSQTELVADSVFGGDVKILVDSSGSLFMVDICLYMDLNLFEDDDEDKAAEKFWKLLNEDSIRFKIYQLVEDEKKWKEMESLGDQILFLGKNSSFAVSAADIYGQEGNCVIANFGSNRGDDRTGKSQETGGSVYKIHSSKFERLTAESKHWKLFWPPPVWVPNTKHGREVMAQEQM